MPEPSVAVVIPVRNAERFLARAVDSVFATGYANLQVAIVDDGSTDSTVRVAERLCVEHADRCRLLRHPDGGNHGVSASRNLGIEACESEWVAFLDADDFYLPNRFDAFRAATETGGQMDALYEICEIRADGGGQAPSPGATDRFGIATSVTGAGLLAELLKGRCWATSAITLRRSLLRRTGGFDPDKRIAEDCDLWFRVAAAGRVAAGDLVHPVSVYWRHADNTYTYRPEHRVAMVRAMLDGWRWACRNGASSGILDTFAAAVPAYVTRSIVAAREAGQPKIAWSLLRVMFVRGRWSYLHRIVVLKQIVGLVGDFVLRRHTGHLMHDR